MIITEDVLFYNPIAWVNTSDFIRWAITSIHLFEFFLLSVTCSLTCIEPPAVLGVAHILLLYHSKISELRTIHKKHSARARQHTASKPTYGSIHPSIHLLRALSRYFCPSQQNRKQARVEDAFSFAFLTIDVEKWQTWVAQHLNAYWDMTEPFSRSPGPWRDQLMYTWVTTVVNRLFFPASMILHCIVSEPICLSNGRWRRDRPFRMAWPSV